MHQKRKATSPGTLPLCSGCVSTGFRNAKEGKPCRYGRKFITKDRPDATIIDFNKMKKKKQSKKEQDDEDHAHVAVESEEESSEEEPEPEPESEKAFAKHRKGGSAHGKFVDFPANEKKQVEADPALALRFAELEKKFELSNVETKTVLGAHQKLAEENAQLRLLVRRSTSDGDDGPQPRSKLHSSHARIGDSVSQW